MHERQLTRSSQKQVFISHASLSPGVMAGIAIEEAIIRIIIVNIFTCYWRLVSRFKRLATNVRNLPTSI